MSFTTRVAAHANQTVPIVCERTLRERSRGGFKIFVIIIASFGERIYRYERCGLDRMLRRVLAPNSNASAVADDGENDSAPARRRLHLAVANDG